MWNLRRKTQTFFWEINKVGAHIPPSFQRTHKSCLWLRCPQKHKRYFYLIWNKFIQLNGLLSSCSFIKRYIFTTLKKIKSSPPAVTCPVWKMQRVEIFLLEVFRRLRRKRALRFLFVCLIIDNTITDLLQVLRTIRMH